MIVRNLVAGGSLAALAQAAQPGAVTPVAAPLRNLTWGQLNFLHTTDTHGWLSGHLQEPQYSADWGDYISFSHHMRKRADDQGVDLLLVDTGDRIEGNGLYDASTPKGLFQYDIYAEQDIDILCTGNHELYKRYSVDLEHNTTVRNYKDHYLASNLDYIDPETGEQVPQAQRYRRFQTNNQGFDIIAMGFIFDFTGNANNSVVQKVEDTIKEQWFQDVIKEKPDLFVISGHVGLRMDEFKAIFTAIRKENWNSPIVFFGGHAHVRDAMSYGADSFAMASGRYMETIGWLSVDKLKKRSSQDISTQAQTKFSRKYLDNNLYGLYHHSDTDEESFPTDHGKRVSQSITKARQALNLDYSFGCAPQNYWMSRAEYGSKDNIYSLITNEVFPSIITSQARKNNSRIALINTGGIRFDIHKGPFTRDSTYIVSPFVSTFKYVPNVPWNIAKRIIAILNSGERILGTHGLDGKFMANPEQMFPREPLKEEVAEQPRLELRDLSTPVNHVSRSDPELIVGYTTKDDIGKDGDDTIHEPFDTYRMPNAIQSDINFPEDGDPETVDVVFIDFLQPWMIPALKMSGGSYDDSDVEEYMDGTFTYHLAEWVRKNWDGDC